MCSAEPRTSPPAQNAERRVIVDVTDLIGHLARDGGVSGIPRVVFEFINAASKLEKDLKVKIVLGFFDLIKAKYLQIEHPSLYGGNDGILHWLHNDPIFRRGYPRPIDLRRIKYKHANHPLKYYWHSLYARFRLFRRQLQYEVLNSFREHAELRQLEFRSGDMLLLLGSSWVAPPLVDYIEPLKKAGIVTPIILIHDLIPFKNLQNDESVPVRIFQPWLDRIGRMGGYFLTVSEATKSDLEKYFLENRIDFHPIAVTPLPHEFTTPSPHPITDALQSLLTENYALFVGPVSGRKNASRLLEAWARLLERLGPKKTPKLVITSRRGADRIYRTHIKPIESHVRLLDRPDDFELSQLYRHAAFTIFPSLYEGWGLPVGESLWHGTPCITSDRSSLPEVGGALCDYVDPTSITSIVAAAERFANDQAYLKSRSADIQRSEFRTWSAFALSIFHTIQLNSQDSAKFAEHDTDYAPTALVS